MHVNDYLTHIQNAEDRPYLRTNLLDVNMRLYNHNAEYRALVRVCCSYLRRVALYDLDGYSKAFGISGANLAVPFNIIGVVHNRSTNSAACQILINPEILEYFGPLVYATSNCGSIRLPNSIQVLRYAKVRVRYYNEAGDRLIHVFDRKEGSYTIQHEVDHNLGVLITDHERVLPDEERPKT
jgi:peptide deformylase